MTENPITRYGLFEGALIPEMWLYLDIWQLPYEPLYRYDSSAIIEVIPYLIELNTNLNKQVVEDFLTKDSYHSGLIIESTDDLRSLVERLAYFYHIVGEDGEPYLRRYFDIRLFNRFLNTLPQHQCEQLFSQNTTFYYLDKTKLFYHKIDFQNQKITFSQVIKEDFLAGIL
ncbi:DUF4123 domain-containing protein [Actinobacillus vicugnae]|uniref:DUF4123 domain-containing protein n=1 Tax=Actinobacillus vicugnae TaxID=2573093 RepID=UPI0012402A8E|nr:DUF4123 domain-containing protein [Actinobacillus vicugnae]